LTGLRRVRYCRAMTIREQWSQGLQWGGCAWIGYRVALSVYEVAVRWRWAPFARALQPIGPVAALWLVALLFIAAGSRWARLAVAAAILGQVAFGLREGAERWSADFPLAWVLIPIVPVCVPALPLAFVRVESPRVVVALVVLGRWREAAARVGSVVPVLVAAGVFAGNRAVLDVLRGGFPVTAYLFGAAGIASMAQGKRVAAIT
jgi:hypothetical protein